ncbi:hypothetical protein CVR96_27830, partial [Salmonella enterica subsp. enterica serovar Typhimurium]|uniref:hypothetical protein n=1 Tax=Salmonella enterica TaxID=28901 RepID=UPI000CB3E619
VMSIGRSFEESLLKGIRSLDIGTEELWLESLAKHCDDILKRRLQYADDERIFIIAELIRRGMSALETHTLTKIDHFYLIKIADMIALEKEVA